MAKDEGNQGAHGGRRAGSGRKKHFDAMLPPTPIVAEVDAAIAAIAAREDIGSKAEAVRCLLDWGLWCDRAMVQISGEGVTPPLVPHFVDMRSLRGLLGEACEVLKQGADDPGLLRSEPVRALGRRIAEVLA